METWCSLNKPTNLDILKKYFIASSSLPLTLFSINSSLKLYFQAYLSPAYEEDSVSDQLCGPLTHQGPSGAILLKDSQQ